MVEKLSVEATNPPLRKDQHPGLASTVPTHNSSESLSPTLAVMTAESAFFILTQAVKTKIYWILLIYCPDKHLLRQPFSHIWNKLEKKHLINM